MNLSTAQPAPSPWPSTRSLDSIQILRAIAALAVLLDHISSELLESLRWQNAVPRFMVGVAGVDLFFVISGFVMVYASEPLFGVSGAPRALFLRRLARIVPFYWTTTFVLLAYGVAARVDFASSWEAARWIIPSFLFIPYPRPDGLMLPYQYVGWTLNYEVMFYLIFAGAILLPRWRAVLVTTGLLVALSVTGLLGQELPGTVAFWCDPIVLEFAFGMFAALAYRSGVTMSPLAGGALVAAGIAALASTEIWGYRGEWRVIEFGLPSAAILVGATLTRSAGALGPISRSLVFLGDASYAIYLVHQVVFSVARQSIGRLVDFSFYPRSYALILLVSSLAVAILSYRSFEQPITRALQRRIVRPAGTESGTSLAGQQADAVAIKPAAQQ